MHSIVSKSFSSYNVTKLTPLTVFRELRLHFYRAIISQDYKFKEPTKEEIEQIEKGPSKIDKDQPFRPFIFDELPPNESNYFSDKKLEATFENFCNDGSEWIKRNDVSDTDKKRIVDSIEDYLILRRAAREE